MILFAGWFYRFGLLIAVTSVGNGCQRRRCSLAKFHFQMILNISFWLGWIIMNDGEWANKRQQQSVE